jgi:biotin synthase
VSSLLAASNEPFIFFQCLKASLMSTQSPVDLRHDWQLSEVAAVYSLPFPELIYRAQSIHRRHFTPGTVQRSTLLSVKTGGCPEDCAYCPQSAHHSTGLARHGVLPVEVVKQHALQAKAAGSTRFCMGAAWREVRDGKEFDKIIELVEAVSALGLEVCCTLGMLSESQAQRLREAGCYAYNHNLDTSPEYYGEIISTRTYQDRLQTLQNVRAAGMTVCCGGIVGMGEKVDDRLGLLTQLATQSPHPESVPLNVLVRVEGTPLQDEQDVDPIEFVRLVATARILMPKSYVRLSAGRMQMSDELQALCFCAGANSIFAGNKLLTTENPSLEKDQRLMERLGMKFQESPAEQCLRAPSAEIASAGAALRA